MAEFYVGQKVVCVSDTWTKDRADVELPRPVKGEIYTIRNFGDGNEPVPVLRVCEIVNQPRQYADGFSELCFRQSRFRPLESKAISIFRKIAADITGGKKVDLREPTKAGWKVFL